MGEKARRWEDWWRDPISVVAQTVLIFSLTIGCAWLFMSDGPPWPAGVAGLVVGGAALWVSVARWREIMR